jgi:hypothetical protein
MNRAIKDAAVKRHHCENHGRVVRTWPATSMPTPTLAH